MANTVGKRRESSHSQQRKHAFQEEGSAAQIRATFGRGEDLEDLGSAASEGRERELSPGLPAPDAVVGGAVGGREMKGRR